MSLANRRVALIGAGSMGEALIRGLTGKGALPPEHLIATGLREARLDRLRDDYGVKVTLDNAAAASQADVVLLALKPQILTEVLKQVSSALQDSVLLISVAAGITTAALEAAAGGGKRVIRAMPNTPALVGFGATAFCRGHHATDDDATLARSIFDAVGETIELDERLMDAVTGLSGSGPAYVFTIIEALADGGVAAGLPRYQAQNLAAQTVLGSAKLLMETGEHPVVLRDKVTSPGGTAIAGLHTLEGGGIRTTLINAVVAATKRAGELGNDE